jgi:hypothetical protein
VALYSISIDAIALAAAAAKSVLELGTTATVRAKIIQWWVDFDGVMAGAVPVKVEVGRFSAAVTTATTLAGSKLDPGEGTAATVAKHSTTTEGAGTASDVENHRVHPQSGKLVQYPLGREWYIGLSGFWRMRLTAAAVVNATVGVIWEE